MEELRDQAAKVLTVYSDTEKDPMALEEVAAKAVEDVTAAESGPQKVATEEKKREYQSELAVRTKKLSEYEAARISDLKLIEKQETQCGELRKQRSQAEEQLCEVEAKLTEVEGKNRQLSKGMREALTTRVERCLREVRVVADQISQRASVTRD
ncbi:hypothetical protein AXG93_2269s1200 [Marchantia polymorpha subsp. ruderalis]|uniref:Uncharacterized protein n=1 Tax=Marchantia polymorpha subsp. ruderalis TaxID=1480154 RepID=A0A176VIJ2_MARPO|nr:hypothetical protein AXG93_2269s1200 [Marchantia polymorpha subsp. ruderalis]